MGKNCGCSKSKNKTVSCESVLEGSFIRYDGVKFTANMSATGTGVNYDASKKKSKTNVLKTLENFLKSYKSKIIDYTYEITTNCDKNCDGECKKGVLTLTLPGEVSYNAMIDNAMIAGAADAGGTLPFSGVMLGVWAAGTTYKATLFTDESKKKKLLDFNGIAHDVKFTLEVQ